VTEPPTLRVVDPGQPGPDDAALTRAAPHNIAAEQVVLGAFMLSAAALAEVRELLNGSEFYRPAHARIWGAICGLADRGAPHDPLAVGAALGRDLSKAGGAPYLHTLIATVPTAVNAAYYAHMLRDLGYARAVVETGTRLVHRGQGAAETGEIADLRGVVAAEVAPLTAADTRGWGEAAPLSATPSLPPFPIWSLPDWLGDYTASLAEQTQTPPDLAGCLSLAVLAVAAAGKVWVKAPAWVEPTNLYTVVVLPPGNRKSEVYRALTAPIQAAERALIDQAKPFIAEAVIRRRIAEANADKAARTAESAAGSMDPDKKTTALIEASEAKLELDAATIPAEPCLFTDDATIERLTSRLAEQGGRFAVLSPEGEIFSIAAGRYSGTPNFGVLKSGHAGETIRIDRQGRPADHIEHATITLGICTQPGVLTRLGDTPQFRDQGLLGRLLYSVPESLLGYRREDPDPIPDAVQAAYDANTKALVLTLATQTEPVTLPFTNDANTAITRMLADTEPRFRPGADLHHMTDWGGKLIGATVRIAALLHLAQHFRTGGWQHPIDADTFDAARQLGDYFTAHAQAAYDTIGAGPAVNNARALLDWAHRTHTTRFTTRDAMRGLKQRFSRATDLDPALRVLEAHGWIRRLPIPPTSGRGRPAAAAYDVHPDTFGDQP
jgi:replicative DNA helicase